MIIVKMIDSKELIEIELPKDIDIITFANLIETTCNTQKVIHFVSINHKHYVIPVDKIVNIELFLK